MVSETETRMEAALMQRDAAMMLLIAQAQGLVQQLALLAGSEKAAVAGLVAVGQAMVAYARATRPDAEVLASFDHVLAALSPGVAGRLTAIRSAAPESADADDDTPGQTRAIKGLLGALAAPHHPPGSPPADDPERMTGVSRSLPIRR